MFAFITVMFSQVKVIVVAVVLIGGTMAVVVDNVVSPRAQGSQHSESDDGDEHGSPREELLAEFAEECGADAVLPDLTGLTDDQVEDLVGPLIDACEDANEIAELLAEFAEECGPDAVPPDVTGLTEDEAEALLEPLIEACDEHEDDALSPEERDELLAEFAEECGPDAVPPDLTGLTEDEAEALIEPLTEACEEANEVPGAPPPCRPEDEDDDENDDGEDESESGGDT